MYCALFLLTERGLGLLANVRDGISCTPVKESANDLSATLSCNFSTCTYCSGNAVGKTLISGTPACEHGENDWTMVQC